MSALIIICTAIGCFSAGVVAGLLVGLDRKRVPSNVDMETLEPFQ